MEIIQQEILDFISYAFKEIKSGTTNKLIKVLTKLDTKVTIYSVGSNVIRIDILDISK